MLPEEASRGSGLSCPQQVPEGEKGAERSVPVWAEAEAALDSWALVSGVLTWPERKVREQEMNAVLGSDPEPMSSPEHQLAMAH